MSETATKPTSSGKKEDADYANPLALKGKGKEETAAIKFLFKPNGNLQARKDGIDSDAVDKGRAANMAAFISGGGTLPPIKAVRCSDAPGHKDEMILVPFDGWHTIEAHGIAKKPEVRVIVWEGTYAQAVAAAGLVANREHDTAGKALSSKEKVNAIRLYKKSLEIAEVPKKEWPSNRQASRLIVGNDSLRWLIGELDPFERRRNGETGDRHEETKEKKRQQRAESNGQETEDTGKNGEEKNRHGIDWAAAEAQVGYMARWLDAFKDIYGKAKDAEFLQAKQDLADVEAFVKRQKKDLAGKSK